MKREKIEKMLEGIDDKYIIQAQLKIRKYKKRKFETAAAIILIIVLCSTIYGGWKIKTQKIEGNNINTKKDAENITGTENKKTMDRVEIKENERLSLTVKKRGKSEEIYKGMTINEGDYKYGVESSTPGIPLVVTDKVRDGATLHIKNENGQIMMEREKGIYEVVKNNGKIESGKTIFWRPAKNTKAGSEVVVTLYKNQQVIGGIVVNIKSIKNSTYKVEYVDNIEIKSDAESMKSTLSLIETVIHDMERDLERNAVPENMLSDTKKRLKEYKKFFEKYDGKIKNKKNKEELYTQFLVEYDKLTDKFNKKK